MLGRARPTSEEWVWRQVWRDVLFLHWRINPDCLRPVVPAELTIDTRDGHAWVSIVLFRLQVAPIWLPYLPGLSSLVEANLRTYVSLGDRPGIYFFSIHADNRAALNLARLMTPLPYQWASIRYLADGERCACELRDARSAPCKLSFQASILPSLSSSHGDTQKSWLLERYRAYAKPRRPALKAATSGRGVGHNDLQQGTVAHERWRVQAVQTTLQTNTLGQPFGLNLDRPPDDAHFCREMHARFSRFERCGVIEGSSPPLAMQPASADFPLCKG